MSKTRSTFFLGLARTLGILVQLISVPIVWDVLGKEMFGVCFFLIAVGRWVSLIDIGYADGAQRLITRAFDSGDREQGFAVFFTHLSLILLHAIVGFSVFVGLAWVVHIPEIHATGAPLSLFFAGACVFAAQYLFQGITMYFNASRQFRYLSLANGSQFLISGLLALGLTLYYRTPQAYLAGFAIGNGAIFVFNAIRAVSQARAEGAHPTFDTGAFKYCFGFGAKLYLTRVSSVTIGTFDRIAITNVLGPAQLTPYANAARIPEAANEALPLNQTLLPDYTRAAMEGERQFAEIVDRGTRISLMAGCGLIFVPAAFGGPVLHLWLGSKYVPEMAVIMALIGLFRAFETFFGGLAQAILAHGTPQKVTWLTMVNAALILAFTYPVAAAWGIVGVAALRVAIHIVQFVPVCWYLGRFVVSGIAFLPWVERLGGTIGVAGVFAAGGYWASHTEIMASHPWLALLAAPLAAAIFFYVTDRLGLAPIPTGIKKRVRALVVRQRA
ncbi:MAG TPA: oligosaccharide flippase family protein [Fimbriimonadaceae bacterium]|nr:oligosaccharide flippase family protein [Fimbriimonadaceae bacterium]